MIESQALAKINGEQVVEWPTDLFIPPDALRVFLETFEGPLDFLLYLIKKQHFEILDIPIAEITRQYMQYVDLMVEIHFELAADYLVMAAWLAEIKSRLLLPRPATATEDPGQDPRAELVRKLQEYEQFREAALALNHLPRVDRDIFIAEVESPVLSIPQATYTIELSDLLSALKAVLARTALFSTHRVIAETLSVRERMTELLSRLSQDQFCEFTQLFNLSEGRIGVVVTLLAILELSRQTIVEFIQAKPFSPIYVRAKLGKEN